MGVLYDTGRYEKGIAILVSLRQPGSPGCVPDSAQGRAQSHENRVDSPCPAAAARRRLTGIRLGYIGYLIVRPDPLASAFTWGQADMVLLDTPALLAVADVHKLSRTACVACQILFHQQG